MIYARLLPFTREFKSTPPLANLGQTLFVNLMFAWGNPKIDMW